MTLTIHQITKSYGANLALDRFTAELEPGIYALLGPNGSGKSTLMNILTDNLKADSGSIAYTSDDGVTEDVLKMGVRFREKLGFMPQYPRLYPNFTVVPEFHGGAVYVVHGRLEGHDEGRGEGADPRNPSGSGVGRRTGAEDRRPVRGHEAETCPRPGRS